MRYVEVGGRDAAFLGIFFSVMTPKNRRAEASLNSDVLLLNLFLLRIFTIKISDD